MPGLRLALSLALACCMVVACHASDYLAISVGSDLDGPTYVARGIYRHQLERVFVLPSGRLIHSWLEASVGAWQGGGEYDKNNFSLGLRYVAATRMGSLERTYLELGFGPVGITDREMNGFRDMGYHLQFDSHLGLSHFLSEQIFFSYRVQHISNGHLGYPNPGMNIQTLTIGRSLQ